MSQSSESVAPTKATRADYEARQVAFKDELEIFVKFVMTAVKQQGFSETLRLLNQGKLPVGDIRDVRAGVVEENPCGLYDAALETDQGPMVLRNAQRTDRPTDPQIITPIQTLDRAKDLAEFTPEQLLLELAEAGANPSCELICAIELGRFDQLQRSRLLPLLWQYILSHRNSNRRDDLVAVGAAVRKYIAIMPMDRMGEVSLLLEAGHRSPIPIELEIEVAKMIYRNFEVFPPAVADPHPELAERLWEIAQAYLNPRILLRDKHAAAASLAIEGIVSMRSVLAEQAWKAAVTSPYQWFGELVSDDLGELRKKWADSNSGATAWLDGCRDKIFAAV